MPGARNKLSTSKKGRSPGVRSFISPMLRLAKRISLVIFLTLFLYESWIFSQVLWWKWNDPKLTSFMSIRLEEMQERNESAKLHYEWVDYPQISSHLKRAVIAAEDGKFLQHSGFDWDAIKKAFKKNIARGQPAAGGSTITQQLAKNLFLSPSKNYFRKLQEAIITVMIEATWDKRRILEVYLNVVEWGDGIFGAQAAAQKHYRISAANLSAYQAAQMAVMLPNPRQFEDRLPSYAVRYSATVRKRMPSTQIP